MNFGCGNSKKEGYVNVDIRKEANPDMILDLNKHPYPFKDSSVDNITSRFLIEHLENPPQFLKECYRILKVGGNLTIVTDNMLGFPYIFDIRKKDGVDWKKYHFMAFNRNMIEYMFINAGFKDIKVNMINCYPLRDYRILLRGFCALFPRFAPRIEGCGKK